MRLRIFYRLPQAIYKAHHVARRAGNGRNITARGLEETAAPKKSGVIRRASLQRKGPSCIIDKNFLS